jgi:D-cysteine desulfhydrase
MPLPAPLAYPERVSLARLPTPLERLERTGERLGIELWVKRDDLTGSELSGNKVRKLEFLLAEARAQGCDTVVTCGGEQSNHCRATALASARLGMRAHLVLRTRDPGHPPAATGNILLDRLAGAEIQWITVAEWARRDELMAGLAERLARDGRRPYIVPEGGSSALGSWGYVRAVVEELDAQLAAMSGGPTTVLYACGSGGTGAGLVLGAAMCGWSQRGIRVTGVNVCDDRDYFLRAIGSICGDFARRFPGAPSISDQDIDILDGYVGLGYARSRPEELREVMDLGRREGLILDPVYTGKAFYALTQQRPRFPARLVFLHTGGIFGWGHAPLPEI